MEEEGKMKGFAEKMSEKFESLETQKKSLRKSIFSVFFEWKGFEEQIVSTQNFFRDGLSQLESKEKELYSVQDSLSQMFKELDSERESVKKKLQQVEDKEKEFKLFSDRGITKLNKEREDFCKEVEFREANLREREKSLEDLLKKLEIQRDEIEGKQEKIMKLNKEREGLLKEIEFQKGKLEIQKDEISESMKEMERRRVEIEGKHEKVTKREKKVEANEKELELMIERQREVDLKAKELDIMIEDLAFKEKDVQLITNLNEKRSKELGMWEKQLDAKEKRLEMLIQKVENQLDNVLEINGGIVKERIEDDHIRGLETEPKEKEVQLNIDTSEKHSKEPPLQKCKEFGVLKKMIDCTIKVAESNHKHSTAEENSDSSHLGKNLQRRLVNEGHHASVQEDAVEESERVFREAQMNQLNDEHHAYVKETAAEEAKEKQLHKRIHEENCKENHLKKKGSHLEKELSVKEKTPSLVGKGIREEGYDLYKFLLDHGKDFNAVVDQVIKTIQRSKEPGKLVLTAIEEFYNRVITEKETEEKKDIAFRSCILLLEQLMKLSVDSHISSMKDEALKLARVWKTNMKIRDSLEVLGFLYLLASYKLANAFPMDAVVRFLEVVAQHQQTPDLCRRLGLKNIIQVLIRELIRKNQILLAFDYVHELELVDEFPPVALLKRHVLSSTMEAKKIINKGKKGKSNHEAQDRALSIEISALKDVIRCIMHRSLQADYPPDELKERIELLERQRESLKVLSPEKQKVESYQSANTQHDNTSRHQSKKKQNKRRRSDRGGRYNKSELPPPSKCPRHVAPPEEHHRSGKHSSHYPDPYAPRQQQQHNQRDPSYRESVYPAHPFPYVEQPPALQSVIMVPVQPIYPAHPSYIR